MRKVFLMIFIMFLATIMVLGQYAISLSTSRGDFDTPYFVYKYDFYIYKSNIEGSYSLQKHTKLNIGVNYLKYDFSAGGPGTEKDNLPGKLLMKTYSIGSGLCYEKYGFFVKPNLSIGFSTLKTKWHYFYTINKSSKIDYYFYDYYNDIITYEFSFRVGYSYTYRNILSLGIYWERIKFYGEERKLSHRVGIYKPNPDYAPPAFSPNNIQVNPDCYVWGVLLKYHFPSKSK